MTKLTIFVFGVMNVLQPALSVNFCITAPGHPHATRVVLYPALFRVTSLLRKYKEKIGEIGNLHQRSSICVQSGNGGFRCLEAREHKSSHFRGERPQEVLKEQVTRGHNIVADRWAGASNPNPHPNPHPTLKHTQIVSKTVVFLLFDSIITDQRTNGWTDQQTDGRTDGQSLL